MTVALALTWNPRGELPRLHRLLPLFEQVYTGLTICFPPAVDALFIQQVREMLAGSPAASVKDAQVHSSLFQWKLVESPVWSWGRYLALQTALEIPASHIQYADLDRLLRWAETRSEEWRATTEKIQDCDFLIIGRTQAAYATHPQALVQTEAISNQIVSHLLGQAVDVSAGSKGFSRKAAEFILANSQPGHALGMDGEWPVLAQRGGFRVDYTMVDGLDWESADRYQSQAASLDHQRQAAEAYDASPHHWARRVAIAQEIVKCSLEAAQRELVFGDRESVRPDSPR